MAIHYQGKARPVKKRGEAERRQELSSRNDDIARLEVTDEEKQQSYHPHRPSAKSIDKNFDADKSEPDGKRQHTGSSIPGYDPLDPFRHPERRKMDSYGIQPSFYGTFVSKPSPMPAWLLHRVHKDCEELESQRGDVLKVSVCSFSETSTEWGSRVSHVHFQRQSGGRAPLLLRSE